VDKNDLSNIIYNAFKWVSRPKAIVRGNSIEDSYVYDYFHNKKNTEIDDLFNEYKYDVSAIIHFLTSDAFIYYLPAFMSLLLYKYEHADVFFDAFIYKLIGKDGCWFSLLNKEQRNAVGLFLRFVLEKHRDEFFDDEVKRIEEAIIKFAK